MKSREEELRQVLKKLMNTTQPLGSFVAKVIDIDEDNLTVDVVTEEAKNAPFYGVRLKPVVQTGNLGIVPIPKKGSFVICSLLDKSERTLYATMVGEVDKLYLDNNQVRIELQDALLLNGDQYTGMVIWEKLMPELNKMSARIDGVIDAIKSAQFGKPPLIPSPDYGAALHESMKVGLSLLVDKESFSDSLINPTIKHGE